MKAAQETVEKEEETSLAQFEVKLFRFTTLSIETDPCAILLQAIAADPLSEDLQENGYKERGQGTLHLLSRPTDKRCRILMRQVDTLTCLVNQNCIPRIFLRHKGHDNILVWRGNDFSTNVYVDQTFAAAFVDTQEVDRFKTLYLDHSMSRPMRN